MPDSYLTNKSAFILIALLLSATLTFGQSKKVLKQARKFFKTNFYSGNIQERNFHEKIKFTNVYNLIILPVQIQGKTYHFIFDSGAPTTISTKIAKELNLKPIANINMDDATQTQAALKNIYRLDSVQLGNVTFLNEGCIGSDFTSLSDASCTNIDGIIGANLMRDCIWTIDYSDSSVTFSNQLPRFPENQKAISFKEDIAGGMPVVPLTIGDTTVSAIVDYGNNNLSLIPRSVFLKAKTNHESTACGHGETMVTMIQSVATGKPQCRAYIENLKLGDEPFAQQLFDIFSGNNLTLIGDAFLSRYKVTLDWKKHTIYFTNASNKNPDNSYYTETFGIKPSWHNGKTIIGFLWDNSEAAKQGISVGDEVIEVNDHKNLDNHDNYCQIQKEVFTNNSVQQIRIILKDKNQNVNTYTLNKQSIFN